MICGSMTFSKEMVEARKRLEEMGYEVRIPVDAEMHVDDPSAIDDLDRNRQHCIENQVMKTCFQYVADADAIVVLNFPKNGIDGYVGTAALMEMGLAYHLGKKIYLLHPYPTPQEYRWALEISVFQPTILHGSLDALERFHKSSPQSQREIAFA